MLFSVTRNDNTICYFEGAERLRNNNLEGPEELKLSSRPSRFRFYSPNESGFEITKKIF